MKYKIGSLLKIINEEVEKLLKENKNTPYIKCNNDWDFNRIHEKSLKTAKQINGLKEKLQRQNQPFSYCFRGMDQATTYDYNAIYKLMREAKNKLDQWHQKNYVKGVLDAQEEKCKIMNNEIIGNEALEKWPDILRKLNQRGSYVSSFQFSIAELFYHEIFHDATDPQLKSQNKRNMLLGNPVEEDPAAISDILPELDIDPTALVPGVNSIKMLTGLDVIAPIAGGDLVQLEGSVGCPEIYRDFKRDAGARLAGAAIGGLGTFGGLVAFHNYANKRAADADPKRYRGWRPDRRYAVTFREKMTSNWKFRSWRLGGMSALYALVGMAILKSPRAKAELQEKQRSAIEELKQSLKARAAAGDTESAEFKDEQKRYDDMTRGTEGGNAVAQFFQGIGIGAACTAAAYHSLILGAAGLRAWIQASDLARLDMKIGSERMATVSKQFMQKFDEAVGESSEPEFALGWISLGRDITLDAGDGPIAFSLFRERDRLATLKQTEVDALVRTSRRVADVQEGVEPTPDQINKLARQLEDNGLNPEGAQMVAKRLLGGDDVIDKVKLNLQNFSDVLVRDRDITLTPFIALLKELSETAAKSGGNRFKETNLMLILQDSIAQLRQLRQDLGRQATDFQTAQQILRGQGSAGTSALKFLRNFREEAMDVGGRKKYVIGDKNSSAEQVASELEDMVKVYSGYARGAVTHRLSQGGILKVPGQALDDVSISYMKYGKTSRLLAAQEAELLADKSIFLGLDKTDAGKKIIDDYIEEIGLLRDTLRTAQENHTKMFGFFRRNSKRNEAFDKTFARVTNAETTIVMKTPHQPIVTLPGGAHGPTNYIEIVINEGTSNSYIYRMGDLSGLPPNARADFEDMLIELRDTKKYVFEASGGNSSTKPIELIPDVKADTLIPESKRVKKINLNILRS